MNLCDLIFSGHQIIGAFFLDGSENDVAPDWVVSLSVDGEDVIATAWSMVDYLNCEVELDVAIKIGKAGGGTDIDIFAKLYDAMRFGNRRILGRTMYGDFYVDPKTRTKQPQPAPHIRH